MVSVVPVAPDMLEPDVPPGVFEASLSDPPGVVGPVMPFTSTEPASIPLTVVNTCHFLHIVCPPRSNGTVMVIEHCSRAESSNANATWRAPAARPRCAVAAAQATRSDTVTWNLLG